MKKLLSFIRIVVLVVIGLTAAEAMAQTTRNVQIGRAGLGSTESDGFRENLVSTYYFETGLVFNVGDTIIVTRTTGPRPSGWRARRASKSSERSRER